METLLQDIDYCFRKLLKEPGFTIVAVLALALGIGANSAIFSVVNAVLLRPLPFHNADRLFMIWENNLKKGIDEIAVSPANYLDFRDQTQAFEELGAIRSGNFTLTGVDEPERIPGASVSANLFSLLNVRPAIGSLFVSEDDQPGSNRVVILSYALWARRFGSAPGIVGTSLTLNGQSYSVIGILPADFRLFRQSDIWVPLVLSSKEKTNRDAGYLGVMGRLKEGMTLARAKSEMETIASRLQQQYPATNADHGVKIVTLQDQIVGNMRLGLQVLLGAVAFVLLIACTNVANLLLARSAARQKEMTIRTALGATRARLIRQLLTESVILALLGGILGLILAFWGVHFLVANLSTEIPRIDDVGIDPLVLGFTLLVSVVTGLIFGLAPALHSSRTDLSDALKEGGRSSTTDSKDHRTRNIFIVAELSLSLVLLIGAGLMIKSFVSLQSVELGFNSKGLLTMQLSLPQSKYPEPHQQAAFYQQVLSDLENLAGVESAAITSALPLSGANINTSFEIEGHPTTGQGDELTANYRMTSPQYFHAMAIPLKKGRFFTDRDTKGSPGVVIINESMERSFFPNEEAIGKRITIEVPPEPITCAVVGVVKDTKHFGLDSPAKPEMFTSFLQNPWPAMTLVVRSNAPLNLVGAIRKQVLTIDKDQPVFNTRSMEQVVSDSIAQPHLYVILLSVFAVIALILAAIGIYGVMSYYVTQRTREVGLRMALGATPAAILKLVVGQGMVLSLIGIGVGLVIAAMMTRLMSGLLYQVSTTDLSTFIGISLLLGIVAFLASYIPARRAIKIDPMTALRHD